MTSPLPDVVAANDPIEEALLALFLHRQAPAPSPAGEADCLDMLRARYAFVDLHRASPDDPRLAFLAPGFRQAALGGHRVLAEASIPSSLRVADDASTRSRGIAAATASGTGSLLSPFTGQVEPVRTSIGREWFVHRHGDDLCLASQLSGTMVVVDAETMWVFPQRRLILHIPAAVDVVAVEQETSRMFSRCLKYGTQFAAYLAREDGPPRGIALSDFFCPHIAHNLWNLQTGWANTLRLAKPGGIGEIITFGGQNFFGSVDELFPDGVGSCPVTTVSSDDEVFLHMMEHNLLLFTVKDEFFTLDFVGRVLARARRHCSAEFLQEVEALRQAAKPLVVTTVRLDNRAWVEQREGFPALFDRLRADYPQIGLVLDGLSSDTAKGWTTMRMSLDAELEMAGDIKRQLPDMPVWFSVGRTIAESIVLVDAADLFVAPTGSGMTLYKWLSNLPGLAFSNRATLDDNSPDHWILRVWHNPAFRPDIAPTKHLPFHLVQDDLAPGEHHTRANFRLDWNDLYHATVPIIETLPAGRR